MHPALWAIAGGMAVVALADRATPDQEQGDRAPDTAEDPGEGEASDDPVADSDPSPAVEGKSPTPDPQPDAREQKRRADRAGEEARKRWQAEVGTPRVEGPQEQPTRSGETESVEESETGQDEAGETGETGHEEPQEDPPDPED